jgi:hypothetical protein
MNLTENQITSIVYESQGKQDVTTRVILPVSLPSDLIRAIDLSDVEPAERERIAKLHAEYREYRDRMMSTMFNFETWVEHTTGDKIEPKWRAFKQSGLR